MFVVQNMHDKVTEKYLHTISNDELVMNEHTETNRVDSDYEFID